MQDLQIVNPGTGQGASASESAAWEVTAEIPDGLSANLPLPDYGRLARENEAAPRRTLRVR